MLAPNCIARFDVQPRTRLRQLIIVATASMSVSGLFFQNTLAETKVKPDLPLDEEIYKPSPAKDEGQPQGEMPAVDKKHASPAHSQKPSHEADQPTSPAELPEMLEEEYHESTPANGSHENSHAKPSLLEGKVQPTPAAKGSGMVWFVTIFLLLAAAIFVFT